MKLTRLILLVIVSMVAGCSGERPDTSNGATTSGTRQEPPNLRQIMAEKDLDGLISRTYWHCETTGALVEAVPAKNSWWWVVEPKDASQCTLRRISKQRFDELDPRRQNGK
jgi:hypothetical protein